MHGKYVENTYTLVDFCDFCWTIRKGAERFEWCHRLSHGGFQPWSSAAGGQRDRTSRDGRTGAMEEHSATEKTQTYWNYTTTL